MADAQSPTPLATVMAYHERSKHRLGAYAAGPQTLDWDAQPDPFRRFEGCALTPLPLAAAHERLGWHALFEPGRAPRAADLDAIGLLLECSFALSAWKTLGPDRWALRVNPSSGNLHPLEVYLIAQGLPDLPDGVFHYAPEEHALEQRAVFPPPAGAPRLRLGFSSIHWREAWKYGERAFRYSQLDLGHAIAGLRYAAALLGWRLADSGMDHADQAALMGLDRANNFPNAEAEEAEAVFDIVLDTGRPRPEGLPPALAQARWSGQANRLDAHPMYTWPVIEAVAQATRRTQARPARPLPPQAARHRIPADDKPAAALITGRRSAQRFDRGARIHTDTLWPLLAALMPQGQLPWDMGIGPAEVHALLFAHRVDGLAPGAYFLPRNATAQAELQGALPRLGWTPVGNSPPELPLWQLACNPALAGTLRTLSCHQAIAADALFVIALLAEFGPGVADAPWRYSERLREAGQIGQVLYLEAEAAGLRGTGIGCFFDDPVRELIGLTGPHMPPWQVLYHFSVGQPVFDARLSSAPPYSEMSP
jgi:SagB-type dehydrogenase family enzyme